MRAFFDASGLLLSVVVLAGCGDTTTPTLDAAPGADAYVADGGVDAGGADERDAGSEADASAADASAADAGAADASAADLRTLCMNICAAFGECSDAGAVFDGCTEGCIIDLTGCGAAELSAIDACEPEACPLLADLMACLMEIACVDGST